MDIILYKIVSFDFVALIVDVHVLYIPVWLKKKEAHLRMFRLMEESFSSPHRLRFVANGS